LRVEVPFYRASQTDSSLPVPVTATFIRSDDETKILDDAISLVKVVSFVASQTVSVCVEGGALITDRNAFVVDEDPVFGASKASLTVPVPTCTTGIRRAHRGSSRARSIHKIEALKASSTVS
jgi:hypothetical protein